MSRFSEGLDPQTQAELDAAMADLDMESMLSGGATGAGADQTSAQPQATRRLNPGDKTTGRIVSVTPNDVFVELGPKRQGVCDIIQFETQPKVGDPIDVIVQRFDGGEGLFYLTRVGAVQKADWEYLEEGQVIEARVTGVNKGGLEIDLAGHRAFMPAGQVDLYHVDKLEDFVGQTIKCEVVEFNREKRNIVLSRRAILERERDQMREQLYSTLEPGMNVEGVVRKIMPFGAFIDLGAGVDGLAHISDLSYSRVKDPGEVVQEGQKVLVRVLKVDQEARRIGLGLKQTQADPFASAAQEIQPGATVTGRVTRIAQFGAFVEIQPGVEGLIHISELAHERIGRVNQVVQEDQIVTAQVLDVDPESRRVSLSLKALQQKAEDEAERPVDPGLAKLKARFGSDRRLKGGLS